MRKMVILIMCILLTGCALIDKTPPDLEVIQKGTYWERVSDFIYNGLNEFLNIDTTSDEEILVK